MSIFNQNISDTVRKIRHYAKRDTKQSLIVTILQSLKKKRL